MTKSVILSGTPPQTLTDMIVESDTRLLNF